jgi:Plavaka transposase
MTQTCASCGKQFQNSVSLDRHGTSCSKKRRRPPVANSQAHQRSRIDPPDNGDDGPSEEPPTIRSVRSGRAVRIPRRLLDYVPHGDMSLAHVPPRAPTPPECDDRSVTPTIDEPSTADQRPHPLQTEANKLGAFRRYTHAPSWLPKNEQRFDLACDSSSIDVPPPPVNIEAIHEISRITSNPYEPFPNFSTAVFMAAYFSETDTKSEHHATSLVAMMQDSRFKAEDLAGFNAHTENVRLDKYLTDGTHPFQVQNGWQAATVHVRLPLEDKLFESEDDAPTLAISGLYHRQITDIVKSVCASKAAESFHFAPFSMHWTPDPDIPHEHERVYADTYMSDSMIQAQLEVDSLPRPEGDIKERVVLGLMLASDSAQLTSFGSASVWPIYMMFANQPKQERVRPSCHAVHHLAYVPSVSSLVSAYGCSTNRYYSSVRTSPVDTSRSWA